MKFAKPSYVRLEQSASTVYPRPIALIFILNPAAGEPTEEMFHALPHQELESILTKKSLPSAKSQNS